MKCTAHYENGPVLEETEKWFVLLNQHRETIFSNLNYRPFLNLRKQKGLHFFNLNDPFPKMHRCKVHH